LAGILKRWKLDMPVIDVAIEAHASTNASSLTFPIDGHLNEAGHAYIAERAAGPLRALIDASLLFAN
jgi:hypothetical protein